MALAKLVAAACAAQLFLTPQPLAAQVDITLIDVGQGDAILITFPPQLNGARKLMLIDGGESRAINNPVVQLLRSRNIETLDFVVLTHPHLDHYGGLIEVFKQFSVREFLWTGETRAGLDTFDAFMDAKANEGVQTVAAPGLKRTSKGATIQVLLAGGNHPNHDAGRNINNDSLSMMLTYQGHRVLFPGDIEDDGGFDLVSRYCGTRSTRSTCSQLEADIIKIPHHGSNELFTPFVAFVKPAIVLVSAGFNNIEHYHPRAEGLETYEEVGAKEFYSTSAEGTNSLTLTIEANGNVVRPTFPAGETYSAWQNVDTAHPCDSGVTHGGLCRIMVAQGRGP